MNKDLVGALAWGIGTVIVALALTFARRQGLVEAETVTRVVIALNGLMIAWFGNRMPKAFVPSARARQVRRVGGWSLALSGLVYAVLWALAPIPTAVAAGCGVVALGIAITVGYALVLRSRAKTA